MFYKIDPSLLCQVDALGYEQDYEVIVYYREPNALGAIFDDKSIQILGKYPFIGAVALRVKKHHIFDLAKNYNIDYVAKTSSAHVLMDNARKIIDVDSLHERGITGKGVNVAIIDTGCYPHLDFVMGKNRIVKFLDFVNNSPAPYDDNGHGTFVAGVLAGNGLVSNQKYSGIAPDSGLIILKALKSDGQTQAYKVLEAMQWIYSNHQKYNIKVVCMSFGSTPLAQNDPLSIGANSLWQQGVVVVTAVGNDGPQAGTVKSPGSSAKVITVGSAFLQGEEIRVADFSSRGPIFEYTKPDLIAPGVNITSVSNDTRFYRQMSGTSVSTPFVAGVSALLLQQNPLLTPNDIKANLLASTTRLPFEPNACGAGLLNATKSVTKLSKQPSQNR